MTVPATSLAWRWLVHLGTRLVQNARRPGSRMLRLKVIPKRGTGGLDLKFQIALS